MLLKEIQSTGNKDTRSGFGDGIVEAARKNSNVVALTADLAGSLKLNQFIKEFPERFIQCGIAEANMIGIGAGLTIGGKIPFTTTFANFSTGRVYDQIRQSVAYSGKNVKICASHAGLTLGEDGATHQILEDIGMMKMLPGMTVIVPCDYAQTKAATQAIAEFEGPVYLRFGRPVWPIFTKEEDFKIGKAQIFSEGSDVSIFACGHLVWNAIQAGAILQEKGFSVEVINMHTIKPLDTEAVINSIRQTNRPIEKIWVGYSRYCGGGGEGNEEKINITELRVQHTKQMSSLIPYEKYCHFLFTYRDLFLQSYSTKNFFSHADQ